MAEAGTGGPLGATQDTLLEVRDLRTYFYTHEGEIRAVDGVSFSLRRGSILGIVGESGCGKSVMSYSVLRLIQKPGRIVGGQMLFRPAGRPPVDLAALSERSEDLFTIRGGIAAMIFQEPMSALSPVHTIGNQICEGILLHQKVTPAEAERLAAEMLARVGIPNAAMRLRQYPHELSGGMRQRVVIAMALVCRPQLLICDEPTTALDVTIQAQILNLIKALVRELGTSVMLITHDLGVMAQMADEIVVMYLGRAVEQADVRTVMKRPLHPYTIGLLESLPSLHREGDRLPAIAGSVPSLTRIPPGCPFHPRCPYAVPGRCDVGGPPPLVELAPGHRVACVRAEEVRATRNVELGVVA
jgi:oligopeptide/dipeptide ABC transporter ATP-binding protein